MSHIKATHVRIRPADDDSAAERIFRLGQACGQQQIQCIDLIDGLVHRVCWWTPECYAGTIVITSGDRLHFCCEQETGITRPQIP